MTPLTSNSFFTADTRVHTTRGTKTVKQLLNKEFTALSQSKEYVCSNGFTEIGTQDVDLVTLKNGITVELATGHGLEVGQLLGLSSNYESQWSGNGTVEEGYVIGHLIGDGTFSQISSGVYPALRVWVHKSTCRNSAILRYLEKAVRTITGEELRFGLMDEKDSGYQCYSLQTVLLRDLFEEYDVRPIEKKIPFDVSKEFARGLLKGLFDTDGCIHENKSSSGKKSGCSIKFSQSNEKRMMTIQQLLLQFGIVSNIYWDHRGPREKQFPNGSISVVQPQHTLSITGEGIKTFRDEIGFLCEKKKAKLNQFIAGYKRKLNRARFASEVVRIESQGQKIVYDCKCTGTVSVNGVIAERIEQQIMQLQI